MIKLKVKTTQVDRKVIVNMFLILNNKNNSYLVIREELKLIRNLFSHRIIKNI
jgi:hypothetical protein